MTSSLHHCYYHIREMLEEIARVEAQVFSEPLKVTNTLL